MNFDGDDGSRIEKNSRGSSIGFNIAMAYCIKFLSGAQMGLSMFIRDRAYTEQILRICSRSMIHLSLSYDILTTLRYNAMPRQAKVPLFGDYLESFTLRNKAISCEAPMEVPQLS